MNYKNMCLISLAEIIMGFLYILPNYFIASLPDAVIRIAGIIMLAGLFTFGYSIAKLKKSKV